MNQDRIEPSPEARMARMEAARQRLETEQQIVEASEVFRTLNAHVEANHIVQKVRAVFRGVL